MANPQATAPHWRQIHTGISHHGAPHVCGRWRMLGIRACWQMGWIAMVMFENDAIIRLTKSMRVRYNGILHVAELSTSSPVMQESPPWICHESKYPA